MSSTGNDTEIVRSLAAAIADNPCHTLKELAESVGISKATLHRLYGTRENIEKSIMEHALKSLESIIDITNNLDGDFTTQLRLLIKAHVDNSEFLRYIYLTNPSKAEKYDLEKYSCAYGDSVDKFFFKGQKQGVFKIDFGAQLLSELFITSIFGLMNAQRNGKVPQRGMCEIFERFFLYGVLENGGNT